MSDAPAPPPIDPKAQAAADKAYAKASRPWYKKKRWIAAIVVAVLILLGSIGGGGGSDDTNEASSSTDSSNASDSGGDAAADNGSSDSTATKKKAPTSTSGKVGTKKNPAPRGTAVKNKSASYRIDNVEVRDSLGDFADQPSGRFVVVTLTVMNLKKETIQISSEDFKLQVGGTEIESDSDAIFLDGAFLYDDLSPSLKRTGKIVYDVAPAQAGKGVLKAQALLSLDDARYLKLQK